MKQFSPINLYVAGKVTGKVNSPAFSRKYAELLTAASLIRKNKAKVEAGQVALSKLQHAPGSAKDTIASMAKTSAKQHELNILLEEGLSLSEKFNATLCEAGKILTEFPAQASRHVILNASELAARIVLFSMRFHARAMSKKADDVLGVALSLEGLLQGAVAVKKGELAASVPRELRDDVDGMLSAVSQKTVPESVRGRFRSLLWQYLYANANFKGFEFEKDSADKANAETYFRLKRSDFAEFICMKVPKVGFDMMVSEVGSYAVPKKTSNPFAAHFRAKKASAAKAALEALSDLSAEAYGKQ